MEHLQSISHILLTPVQHLTHPGARIFVLYLATSLLIALIIHFKQERSQQTSEGPITGIFPTQVYTHRSTMVDYIYFITNTILYAIILAPFAGFGMFISRNIQLVLASFFTPHVMTEVSAIALTACYSVILALLADFGTFIAHYWMHRIPVLWEFHKVHHSAEVMTPITVYRMHPIDDILTLIIIGVFSGTVDAFVRFFVAPGLSLYTVYGLGVASYIFFITGYHLRHSHIWLSYGPLFSKIFISPAQHQIHHSTAKRHWNKNFGFILATWDHLFGSLYIPKEREQIKFGLGNGEDALYSSPLKLYFLPFKRALRILRSKK